MERRNKVRFPLELPVRYRTLGKGCPGIGAGWVQNISSGGILVAAQHEVSVGTRIELNIEWPFLLDGRVPLQLVTMGSVARCDDSSFALALSRHQFRTTRKANLLLEFSGSARKTASA